MAKATLHLSECLWVFAMFEKFSLRKKIKFYVYVQKELSRFCESHTTGFVPRHRTLPAIFYEILDNGGGYKIM